MYYMDLPIDIWENILKKTSNRENCYNLFNALPESSKKLLKNAYSDHIDLLTDYLILGIQNVAIASRDTDIIAYRDFLFEIKKIKHAPYYGEAIICLSNDEIIIWNFVDDEIVYLPDPLLEDNYKYSNFIQSKCRRYLFVSKLEPDVIFYKYNIYDESGPIYFQMINESSLTNDTRKKLLTIVNPVKPELMTIYCSSRMNMENKYYQINIYNYENETKIFQSNFKVKYGYYDDNGKLYVSNSKKIFEVDSQFNFNVIFEIDFIQEDKIILFLKNNNKLYYVIKHEYYCTIYEYNLSTKKKTFIYKDYNKRIYNFNLIRNGEHIIYDNTDEIVIIDIAQKTIAKKYILSNFLDNPNIEHLFDYSEYGPILFDFDKL